MCLPSKSEHKPTAESDHEPTSGISTLLGAGGLMLLACIAGPAIAGAVGALGVGLLVGAGGAIVALAICLVPVAFVSLRRRSQVRQAS